MGRNGKQNELPIASRLAPHLSRASRSCDALRLDLITPDKFHDECAVFGIYGHKEASNLTYLGLYALQHRGQESAGIAASDGGLIRHHKAMVYVNEAFNSESLAKLPGSWAVGHVRYSTAGESLVANAHPIVVDSVH